MYIVGYGGFAIEIDGLLMRNNITKTGNVVTDATYQTNNIGLISEIPNESQIILAIGSPNVKQNIFDKYIRNSNIRYPNIIDKSVTFVGKVPTYIESGLLLLPNSTITSDVEFGKFVSVDRMVSIGHGARIGDFSQISPMSIISGDVNIGNRCYIGTGAMIKEKVNICDDVIIGMGSVVLNDITEPGTYVGNKLRRIK